jgi:uncharacterized membrane protein YhdT
MEEISSDLLLCRIDHWLSSSLLLLLLLIVLLILLVVLVLRDLFLSDDRLTSGMYSQMDSC